MPPSVVVDPYVSQMSIFFSILILISSVFCYRVVAYYFEKRGGRSSSGKHGPTKLSLSKATFLVRAIFFACVVYYEINQLIKVNLQNVNNAICQVTMVGSSFMYGFSKYWLYNFLFLKQAAVQTTGDPFQKKFSEFSKMERFLLCFTQVYLLALLFFLILARASLTADGICLSNYANGATGIISITSPIVGVFEVVLSIGYLYLFVRPLRDHSKNFEKMFNPVTSMSTTQSLLISGEHAKLSRLENLVKRNLTACGLAMLFTLTNIAFSIVFVSAPVGDMFLSGDIISGSSAMDVFLNACAILVCMTHEMWTEWSVYKRVCCIAPKPKQLIVGHSSSAQGTTEGMFRTTSNGLKSSVTTFGQTSDQNKV
eukprot:TRINITY_DN25251_c0_g1_i1.p1 TRINITY_DN25251_c0_g1~~TRINITY_DN25251_c0_g1_i1.p1  ORF type:complete len:369 (-),score=77.79 TRINITY_DN25251_c0_g1_i1:44-1150(-)